MGFLVGDNPISPIPALTSLPLYRTLISFIHHIKSLSIPTPVTSCTSYSFFSTHPRLYNSSMHLRPTTPRGIPSHLTLCRRITDPQRLFINVDTSSGFTDPLSRNGCPPAKLLGLRGPPSHASAIKTNSHCDSCDFLDSASAYHR